ncbi:branched-chain amino acid transport system permease protein [Allopseudospirillum japonicum]|uniref:Branched-chain amino acid transport system permease protein n=1 Tax=Allopseudospirillum japonicum TaxID=64971 RepID=A0A1H6T4V1_9GAMM|nr:branched-chain amino acid ABC transporter permease [Allopseudospirillum japonicum]SEI70802.1 branched-chain amino acid transport system permease protein [Allopseudospirillum japonicum]
MMQALKSPRLGGLSALSCVLIILPFTLSNSFQLDVAIQVGIAAIVVVGLNLLVGFAGQISLGHAGFMGMGAYMSAILSGTYGWSPLLALIFAAICVGGLAFLIGGPILRLKGHYLSMATLGLGIIIAIVINTESWLTGGPDGLVVEPLSLFGWALSPFDEYHLLGISLSGTQVWYILIASLLVFAVWLALNIIDSPTGRALRAVHGSEIAAQVVGVNTAHYKVKVFVISAVFASVMGSLSAHYTGFITPNIAGFHHSIELITMVVLGGMASTYGVILGAVILVLLPQVLADLQEFEMLAFGLILMVTMIFMPKGLLPTLLNLLNKPKQKTTSEEAA